MSTSTPKILTTSLAEIKSFNPCQSGWKDILKGQGKAEADEELFPLLDCLNSNSISDVCWLIGKRKIEIEICVKFAKMCADSVKYLKHIIYAADAADAADAAASAAASASAASAAAYAVSAAASAAAAAYAAYAAYAYAAYAAYAAHRIQKEKNKQFLAQCIQEY